MLRKCIICGKEFETSGSAKTCSDECRHVRLISKKYEWRYSHTDINRRETKTCIVCGKSFIPSKNSIQVTCSEECRKEHRKELQRQRYDGDSWNEYVAKMSEKSNKHREEKRKLREKRKTESLITGKCVVCGKEFTTLNPLQKTCSKKCGRRWASRLQSHRLDGKIVNNDITLEALYNRDSGVCYLCGCKCNWDDKTVTPEGFTITGPTYPTIEHVLPLAMGGLHSWKNIRLACFKCNSIKGATVPEGYEAEKESLYVPKGHRQEVTQYTKDGRLVQHYSSTAEAGRITGLKPKQIQNCARGESKSYGGYLWKYGGVSTSPGRGSDLQAGTTTSLTQF